MINVKLLMCVSSVGIVISMPNNQRDAVLGTVITPIFGIGNDNSNFFLAKLSSIALSRVCLPETTSFTVRQNGGS
jgi:hypothetical protein